MNSQPIKYGLVALIIFQIAGIFIMLNVYNKFAANPDNYYQNILNRQINEEINVLDRVSPAEDF
jgi:cbb3-type cytochrome oxidase subunit 3